MVSETCLILLLALAKTMAIICLLYSVINVELAFRSKKSLQKNAGKMNVCTTKENNKITIFTNILSFSM